jgi:hypothetical protein
MENIWLSWEIHRRNRAICQTLGWPLFEIISDKQRVLRYIICSIKTIIILIRERPKFVVAQNPSIVLAILITGMKHVFHYKAIIDAHNSGIFPMEGQNRLAMMVSKHLQKQADLTIVTNDQLMNEVVSNGGRAFVMPDSIPETPSTSQSALKGRVNIAYICSYNIDEPYKQVFEAARLISPDVFIYTTGKYQGKIDSTMVPANVKLLGFISESDFWSILSTADFIMDLTLREGCLVCGAYEGVALKKPLILSDTKALRTHFSKGCVYVQPTAESIAAGINHIIVNRQSFQSDINDLKVDLINKWQETAHDFFKAIKSL